MLYENGFVAMLQYLFAAVAQANMDRIAGFLGLQALVAAIWQALNQTI